MLIIATLVTKKEEANRVVKKKNKHYDHYIKKKDSLAPLAFYKAKYTGNYERSLKEAQLRHRVVIVPSELRYIAPFIDNSTEANNWPS